MFISRVSLENFRNFKALDLSLNQGFVVLSGPNGAGKTNFLEGLYFAACLGRFPESQFHQLFQNGADHFRIKLVYQQDSEEVEQGVFVEKSEGSYKYKLTQNGKKVRRSEYAVSLPVVSFLPQDLNLLTRSPSNRRRYLDETLSTASKEYQRAAWQYQKTLRQRNELLDKISQGQGQEADLTVWDEQLASWGSQITNAREKFFEYLNKKITPVIQNIAPELVDMEFVYLPSGETGKSAFLDKLQKLREQELIKGTTAIGPHRDDFMVKVEGKQAVGYLSRGQMRGVTLALKFLEKEFIEEKTKKPPILLLDDVFSEFDHAHQQRLLEFLKALPQVFLTTAHLEEIEKFLPEKAEVFKIEQGKVSDV